MMAGSCKLEYMGCEKVRVLSFHSREFINVYPNHYYDYFTRKKNQNLLSPMKQKQKNLLKHQHLNQIQQMWKNPL